MVVQTRPKQWQHQATLPVWKGRVSEGQLDGDHQSTDDCQKRKVQFFSGDEPLNRLVIHSQTVSSKYIYANQME